MQYFERNRLEYHPEAKGTPAEIQLGLLGKEFYQRTYGNAPPPAASPDPVSMACAPAMTRWGNDLRVVRTVATTSAYTQYAIIYRSGNLNITGQMYVPTGTGPFPVMIMNHGFIPIAEYTSRHGFAPGVALCGIQRLRGHPPRFPQLCRLGR